MRWCETTGHPWVYSDACHPGAVECCWDIGDDLSKNAPQLSHVTINGRLVRDATSINVPKLGLLCCTPRLDALWVPSLWFDPLENGPDP
ncbi:hypothetical protein U1Q18_025448 [Sarracenia purpurea var. burkii]